MTDDAPAAQDIEIYIKSVRPDDIITWLKTEFKHAELIKNKPGTPKKGQWLAVTDAKALTIEVLIIEKVAGGYSSVWFDSTQTPWTTDIECAQAAHKALDKEIRCTMGSWSEDQDPDLWISLSSEGQQEVIWKI